MRIQRLTLTLAAALAASACTSIPSGPDGSEASATAARTKTRANAALPVVDESPFGGMSQPSTGEAALPDDLWARIRAGFAMGELNHPRVESEIQFFAQRPEFMERVVERAEPYLHYIVEEVARRGMPMEIALLPVVESAFQPSAYSSAHAAGIWQFIPTTGLHYGLKQNWWYDGRRDVVASTRAALDYLQTLHGMFNDWSLALAAYNAGEGAVGRAIKRNERNGEPTDYWNLPLPRETRHYVPRLLAIRALVGEPATYGITLRSIPNEPYLEVVDVGSQIDLALAADLAGLSVDDVTRLNPGFHRWATDPDGPHLLALPTSNVERFLAGLDTLPLEKRVRWQRHRVSSGDTLIEIARRYGTTVNIVKDTNRLSSNMIRIGQHLLVPNSADAQLASNTTQKAPQAKAKVAHAAVQVKRHHTVRPGDTLWDLSRTHGVSVAEIANWNGIGRNESLRPGQKLVVSMQQGGPGKARNAAGRAQTVSYTVRKGDSLYAIAKQFEVTVEQLRQWNNLSRRGYLQPGQRLTVHADTARQQDSI